MAKKSKRAPRDPSVMQKAWATRRKNAKKAKQEAASYAQSINNELRRATGSTARRPKKARAGKGKATRRSNFQQAAADVRKFAQNAMVQLIDGPLASATTAHGASQAEGANRATAPDQSPFHQLGVTAREIIVEARKKGGEEAVQDRLRSLIHKARHERSIEMNNQTGEAVRDYARAVTEKVVCSFLATADQYARANRGLAASMMVSGYTLARIIDILNENGWHPEGYRKPSAT